MSSRSSFAIPKRRNRRPYGRRFRESLLLRCLGTRQVSPCPLEGELPLLRRGSWWSLWPFFDDLSPGPATSLGPRRTIGRTRLHRLVVWEVMFRAKGADPLKVEGRRGECEEDAQLH